MASHRVAPATDAESSPTEAWTPTMFQVEIAAAEDDSPQFRLALEEMETSARKFADAVHALGAVARRCVECERQLLTANASFANHLADLVNVDRAAAVDTVPLTGSALAKCAKLLTQLDAAREQALEHFETHVVVPCLQYGTADQQELKEKKSHFEHSSEAFEAELTRYCGLSRKAAAKGKDAESIEALRAARREFHRASAEYCLFLNDLHTSKKLAFLERLLEHMDALYAQGDGAVTVLANFRPVYSEIQVQVAQFKSKLEAERMDRSTRLQELVDGAAARFDRDMQALPNASQLLAPFKANSPSMLEGPVGSPEPDGSVVGTSTARSMSIQSALGSEAAPVPLMLSSLVRETSSLAALAEDKSGYLFKRSSGAIKRWDRRWFHLSVNDMRMQYYTPKDLENPTVAMYLNNVQVRDADGFEDRRFVFVVTSPTVQYYLQAESERQQYEWMVAIANAAAVSGRRNMASSTSNLLPQPGPLMRSRSTSGSNSALFPTSSSAVPVPPKPAMATVADSPPMTRQRQNSSSSSIMSLTQFLGSTPPSSLSHSQSRLSVEPPREEGHSKQPSRYSFDLPAEEFSTGADRTLAVRLPVALQDEAMVQKQGELQLRRDRAALTAESASSGAKGVARGGLARAASFVVSLDASGSADHWKPTYAVLTADGQLLAFEVEKKSANRFKATPFSKPLLVASLHSLDPGGVQAVHESAAGRRYVFSVSVKKARHLFSAPTRFERDSWMLTIKRAAMDHAALDAALNGQPLSLAPRRVWNLRVEVVEARHVPAADLYCELLLDGVKVAATPVRPKASAPYWGEPFEFEDLPELTRGLAVAIKVSQRLTRNTEIGVATVSPAELLHKNGEAQWYPLLPPASDKASAAGPSAEDAAAPAPKPEVKLLISSTTLHVHPQAAYENLLDATLSCPPAVLYELAKHADNLESLANGNERPQNLLRINEANGTALEWLMDLVSHEVMSSDNTATLFRGNSLATKATDLYMKLIATPYLHSTIGAVIRTIFAAKTSSEVDPTRLAPGEDVARNWVRLRQQTTNVWACIRDSIGTMPKELRVLFRHLQETAAKAFPKDSMVRYTSVSGLLFLRFFCPAVLSPKLFDLVSEHADDRTRRTLTLIAKTLQVLANLGSFGIKEQFMSPMNEFLMRPRSVSQEYSSQLMDFIDDVANYPEDYVPTRRYPIDLPLELATFQHFVATHAGALSELKVEPISRLIAACRELSAHDGSHPGDD